MKNGSMIVNAAIIAAAALVSVAALFGLQGVVPLSYATANAPNVIASVSVPLSCAISLSTTSVSFGSLNAGTTTTNTPYNVLDTNGGNEGTFIWVYGTNWGGTGSFGVGNTVWSSSSANTIAQSFPLTTSTSNTNIAVGAAGSSNIWLGLTVPNGQAAGSYTQNVVITNVC